MSRLFASQSGDGVIKELMFALVYNLVRAAMAGAGRQGIADANRISFINALRWLSSLLPAPAKSMVRELIVNPPRSGRSHPRVKKRRMKECDPMNKPRWKYAEPVTNARVEA